MKLIYFIILLIPTIVFAQNTTGANNAGKAFADALNNSTIKDTASNLDPTVVPGYQGASPPQVQYRNSGSNIENQARQESTTDPTAQFIFGARNSRPVVVIDKQNDPMFMRTEEIRDLSNGLTENGYQGCITLPVGTENMDVVTNDTCNATRGITDETCSNTLAVKVDVLETCKPGSVINTIRVKSFHWRWVSTDYLDISTICSGDPNTARFNIVKPSKNKIDRCGGKSDVYTKLSTPALRDNVTFDLPMVNSGRKWSVDHIDAFWFRRGSTSRGAECDRMEIDLVSASCNTAACSFKFDGFGWVFGTRSRPGYGFGFSDSTIGTTKYKRVVQSITDVWDDKCKVLDDRL